MGRIVFDSRRITGRVDGHDQPALRVVLRAHTRPAQRIDPSVQVMCGARAIEKLRGVARTVRDSNQVTAGIVPVPNALAHRVDNARYATARIAFEPDFDSLWSRYAAVAESQNVIV